MNARIEPRLGDTLSKAEAMLAEIIRRHGYAKAQKHLEKLVGKATLAVWFQAVALLKNTENKRKRSKHAKD